MTINISNNPYKNFLKMPGQYGFGDYSAQNTVVSLPQQIASVKVSDVQTQNDELTTVDEEELLNQNQEQPEEQEDVQEENKPLDDQMDIESTLAMPQETQEEQPQIDEEKPQEPQENTDTEATTATEETTETKEQEEPQGIYDENGYFWYEDGTYYEHYSEDGSEIISYISPNEKEFLNMLDNMTFMSYCAPVFIPVCTLLLLAMVIYLVISIGHTKRKK